MEKVNSKVFNIDIDNNNITLNVNVYFREVKFNGESGTVVHFYVIEVEYNNIIEYFEHIENKKVEAHNCETSIEQILYFIFEDGRFGEMSYNDFCNEFGFIENHFNAKIYRNCICNNAKLDHLFLNQKERLRAYEYFFSIGNDSLNIDF